MTAAEKRVVTQEHKSLHLQIKAQGDGLIEAYAAVFNTVDDYGDVIQPGAFTKTILERGPAGSKKIKALYNHDGWSNLPVGSPTSMIEDSYGLLTATKMSATQLGQDIYTLAGEGAITDMSIGYYALQATYPDDADSRTKGIWRFLSEVKLVEYSFLGVPPANEGAIITAVKSGMDLEREIRRWKAIAEVGLYSKAGRVLSAANAKKILSALSELQDLVSAAGLDEAADDSTSTGATAEKSSAEPPKHSLLAGLQQYARHQEAESKHADFVRDLRSYGQSLGGNA